MKARNLRQGSHARWFVDGFFYANVIHEPNFFLKVFANAIYGKYARWTVKDEVFISTLEPASAG